MFLASAFAAPENMMTMLPEFKTLRIYVPPGVPTTNPHPPGGERLNHGEKLVDVAPDNASEIHDGDFEQHTLDHHSVVRYRGNRASGPDYVVYTTVNGKQVVTYTGKINLCHVVMNSGEELANVIGTRQAVAQYLRPYACPPAAETGITVTVTTGKYDFKGDCGGARVLAVADGAFTLDPARLTGYEHTKPNGEKEHRNEWFLAKKANGNTRNYRFRIDQASSKTFTLQQWVPGSEPRSPGTWNDLVGTNSLQAETRLRVKP